MIYRALSTFIAVTAGPRCRLIAVPAGTIIEVTRPPNQIGLVETTCEGNEVLVFMRDVDEKCEMVKKIGGAEAEPIPHKKAG